MVCRITMFPSTISIFPCEILQYLHPRRVPISFSPFSSAESMHPYYRPPHVLTSYQCANPFRSGGASQGTPSSNPDEANEEFLNVRDVVELLRDFLRAKALTESEISREV